MVKNLPNIVTCLNLYAGCLSCVMSLAYDNYVGAFLFIMLAAFFDFLDGFIARLLKSNSPLGAQLDSLADVVSFGVAPGFLVYSFLMSSSTGVLFGMNTPFIAFLIPVFAGLRLAKFNIDNRQTSSFLGLPVPANGLFWGALIPSISLSESNHTFYTYSIVILIVVFCLLMISKLPMYSFKFTNYKLIGNQYPYITILIAIVLTVFFHLNGIYLTIVGYIFLSIFRYVFIIIKKTA